MNFGGTSSSGKHMIYIQDRVEEVVSSSYCHPNSVSICNRWMWIPKWWGSIHHICINIHIMYLYIYIVYTIYYSPNLFARIFWSGWHLFHLWVVRISILEATQRFIVQVQAHGYNPMFDDVWWCLMIASPNWLGNTYRASDQSIKVHALGIHILHISLIFLRDLGMPFLWRRLRNTAWYMEIEAWHCEGKTWKNTIWVWINTY